MIYNDAPQIKTTVPKVYYKVLPRKKISDVFDNETPNRAVCVISPYGCGKTLSVIAWLNQTSRRPAWLSLDEQDNVRDIFLADLTAAILPLFQNAGHTDDFRTNEKYIESPLDFLLEISSGPICEGCDKTLVLDNCAQIKSAEIWRIITHLISAFIGIWRIILVSRTEIPPVFNDLILKGYICMVTLEDLKFSKEEMSRYFSINGHNVPERDILELWERTEGWPAALNVVLSVSHRNAIAYGESIIDYVRAFFEVEVWNTLSKDIQKFLLETAVLETLTPTSCHAVTGMGATLPTLKWMFQNGIFIAKTSKRDTFRYLRVFRDFLLDKLDSSGMDIQSIYKKYAWWLFERDQIEQSFPYFFKARDLYGVRQVLKILNPIIMGMEGFLELCGCITELCINELGQYPEVVAQIALVHYLMGDVAQMQSHYHTLLEWMETGEMHLSPEEYSECMWEIGWLCYMNPDEPTQGNQQHLDFCNYGRYVPHLKELHIARTAIYGFPSVLRGIRDYGDDGLYDTEGILNRIENGDSILTEEESVWQTYLLWAEYLYEIENFVKAEEIVRRVMPLVEDRRYTHIYFICTVLLAKLIRATRNPKEIAPLSDRMKMMIVGNNNRFLLPNLHAFEQRNRLLDGHSGFTSEFLTENRLYEDKPYFYLLYRHITYARGLISTGNFSEAIIILSNTELLCQRYKRPTDLIEINILMSIALHGIGHMDSALGHFMDALTAARKYGFIRIFSDDAKDIWPILELVRKKSNDKYLQSIIISCKKTLARLGLKASSGDVPRAELTKTELKILKSLQSGMSYEEIGLDNGIRISTVKSHTHSIYSKLDVSNKISAIMEAIRLGILE